MERQRFKNFRQNSAISRNSRLGAMGIYETEKAKIARTAATGLEYQRQIASLVKRLGI